MMNPSTKPPQALLDAIARDLRPVSPSPLPFGLVKRMAPLAVLVSCVVLLLVGVRRDHQILGPMLTWGASLAQLSVAVMIIWVAARESTPASKLPKKAVYFTTVAACLLVVMLARLTFSASPTRVSARVSPLFMGLACGIGSTIAGGVLVGLLSLVYRKTLTMRPAIAGALYGFGAGVAINAGWRLACPVSEPWHAIGAHGMAVFAITLVGALVGSIVAPHLGGSPVRKC